MNLFREGSITVTSQHVEPWIPNLGLTSVEKSSLDNDQDICDKLVDAGMKLLTRDFPQFEYHSHSIRGSVWETNTLFIVC